MAKTDWNLNDIVRPQDMNGIGEELNQLRSDIDNIDVPPASLTKAGIVQLSNATDGTSETKAPTEKALGLVMAEAQAGKQSGIERKNEVVAALNSIGVSASTSESWDSLITKMAAIIKATGNAVAADVLSGKTFSNAGANDMTGTMPNRGAGGTVTPTTTNQTRAAGYYSSAITILGDAKLLPANLPKDITLFGIAGILERMTTAEKQTIANSISGKGVPASVNDSNTVLAQKINQIVNGVRYAYRIFEFNPLPSGTIIDVNDLDFTPRMVVVVVNRGYLYDDMIMFISTIPTYSSSNKTYTGMSMWGNSGDITTYNMLTNITTSIRYGFIKTNGFVANPGLSGASVATIECYIYG